MKIAGLILAAGVSTRMGYENKLLMPFEEKPMVSHVLEASLDSNLDHTCMVVGHDPTEIKTLVENKEIQIVDNEVWVLGMASSIVAGVEQLNEYDGILILLGDMPLVTSALINEIIDQSSLDKIIVPVKDGSQGNPVFFGSNFIHELMTLEGDSGAKKVIQNNPSSILEIAVKSDAIFRDFDTHESFKVSDGAP